MFAITERLLLRPGWAEDALPLRAAIAHEDVAFMLARLPWPYTLGDAQFWLKQKRTEGEANFLILKRTSGAPAIIGGIGIHDHDGLPEIGYWLTPAEWGKGYVTEAGRAVVDLARHSLRIPQLVAGHFADNPASGKVLRKLGFRPTGRIESRMCTATGKARPCVLFAQDLAVGSTPEDGPARMQMRHAMRLAA
jgi:RimJ/RimL family protein N-acetyltransferase